MIGSSAIVFVRHGETNANRENRLVGQIDPVLNEQGIRQAFEHARRFSTISFAHVYSSHLRRSYETAKLITQHNNNVLDPLLRENSGGEWDGLKLDDIMKTEEGRIRNADKYMVRPPGGESYKDVESRLREFFRKRRIFNQEKPILVVSHKGVLRCISHVFGGSSSDEAGQERFEHEDWIVLNVNRSKLTYAKFTGDITSATRTLPLKNKEC